MKKEPIVAVLEEIRDALHAIQSSLEKINEDKEEKFRRSAHISFQD